MIDSYAIITNDKKCGFIANQKSFRDCIEGIDVYFWQGLIMILIIFSICSIWMPSIDLIWKMIKIVFLFLVILLLIVSVKMY